VIFSPETPLQALRIFVIEAQSLLAGAICSALVHDGSIEVIGHAPAVDRPALAAATPDVIIADCDHDVAATQRLISDCRSAAPGALICIFSTHLSAEMMMQAFAAGAHGYIVKDVSAPDLVASVKCLAADRFYADRRLANSMLRDGKHRNVARLSLREIQVIQLVAEGLSNKEIGARLTLSDKTVKNHLTNIFEKLNVSSRSQVVSYAIRSGMA
jgi:two-component system response regulator DegU